MNKLSDLYVTQKISVLYCSLSVAASPGRISHSQSITLT
jgi:hypothetical protein